MIELLAVTYALAGVGLDWARQVLLHEEYGRRLTRALHGVPLTYSPDSLTRIRNRIKETR